MIILFGSAFVMADELDTIAVPTYSSFSKSKS